MRLSEEQFAALVEKALSDLPDRFRELLQGVVVDVEPMPDRRTCREMEEDDPRELLGLYQGTPLTERGVEYDGGLPDRIVIYQRNIERLCRSPREIIEQVRTTVLHEVGHHFGLDEDELEELGYE